jgi:hypothetical protein
MVANVGEILEPEADEDGQDGSGFDVKKVPGDKTEKK